MIAILASNVDGRFAAIHEVAVAAMPIDAQAHPKHQTPVDEGVAIGEPKSFTCNILGQFWGMSPQGLVRGRA
jgi:hypothetical protein